ncbi:MAG: hypothetical protein WDO13_02000 [Verrucomicrobiota bacterium]
MIKFALVFVLMTALCTLLWEMLVDNHLYNCTDGGFLDYLTPGDWVHSVEGRPLETIPHVVLDRDMEHADTIQEGWTVGRLWTLWYLFFGVSVVISGALAVLPCRPAGQRRAATASSG